MSTAAYAAMVRQSVVTRVGDDYETINWKSIDGRGTWQCDMVLLPGNSNASREQASLSLGPDTELIGIFLSNTGIPEENARARWGNRGLMLKQLLVYFDEYYECRIEVTA